MMNDPRIQKLKDATEAMAHGSFLVDIPSQRGDELDQLGLSLKHLAQTLEKRFLELNALLSITRKVNMGILLEEVLNFVFESFRPMIPYNRIGLALLEEDGAVLRARWARSDTPELKISIGYSSSMSGSSLQTILETGVPRVLNDLEAYLKQHPDSESTKMVLAEGIRSSLTCPLIAMGRPIGFIFFSKFEPNAYQEVHVSLFMRIAEQLSVIVEKSRLYQELAELNQLKNKFIGIAAHDLRNPIGAVMGFAELLADGLLGELNADQTEAIENIRASAQTMRVLVNDLLDLRAIEAGTLALNLEKVQLPDYLEHCHRTFAILARAKTMDLVLELQKDLPAVDLDKNRIEQVIGNLVGNAIKFSPPSTRIVLGARTGSQGVEIFVRDQGPGIAPEEVQDLFREFGRGRAKPTGGEKTTGLGLAIVKRVVEAHGGTIQVDSIPGQGSTFFFTLEAGEQPSGLSA